MEGMEATEGWGESGGGKRWSENGDGMKSEVEVEWWRVSEWSGVEWSGWQVTLVGMRCDEMGKGDGSEGDDGRRGGEQKRGRDEGSKWRRREEWMGDGMGWRDWGKDKKDKKE